MLGEFFCNFVWVIVLVGAARMERTKIIFHEHEALEIKQLF
jgi:hypothetical protein